MSTFTQILYQVVFSTKHRQPTLEAKHRPLLYKYIGGILKNKKCHLYEMGGVEDHLHIITHLHPGIALADMVKDVKLASSYFIKKSGILPAFAGWQDGYGAFSLFNRFEG